ncbi:MAG TPA: 2-dehydropantoate 2-reductase N-terminal domain-containing protein, partial [Trebonia sp.]|nr:2-dehydropantoate 2-reductase N-terminal domain-containing protein [Trebonia sp.]
MTGQTAWTIVGAGAIGGTLGHALAKAGHPVTVVDADADHVAAVAARGLRIRRDEVGRHDGPIEAAGVVAAYTPGSAPGTLRGLRHVILATKSQHTADAAAWIAPRLADDGFVLSAQNGLNEPVIAEYTGADRVIGAFINIFADYEEPGLIRDGGPGAVVLGLGPGVPPDARTLEAAEDLRSYGTVGTTANLIGYRWAKRAFASILGVSSVTDAPIAEVVDRYRDVAGAVAQEVTE